MLSNLGIVFALIILVLFVFLGVVSDMFGVVVASSDLDVLQRWRDSGLPGAETGYIICKNSEKVCTFCGDVIGDICSTLCGAG